MKHLITYTMEQYQLQTVSINNCIYKVRRLSQTTSILAEYEFRLVTQIFSYLTLFKFISHTL